MDTDPACLIPESPYHHSCHSLMHIWQPTASIMFILVRKYPWLDNQEVDESVLCYYCLVTDKRVLVSIAHNKSSDYKFKRIGF